MKSHYRFSEELISIQSQGINVNDASFDWPEAPAAGFVAQEYCTISNSLRRVLATIGLKRIPKDITRESDQQRLDRVLGYIDGEVVS